MGGYKEVREIFSTLLEEYGQQVKKMTLVLFEAALEHLCRIHRIIRNPRGYLMLCYVMLFYLMLCFIMLCYVMLCYIMLCYVILCNVLLYYVILCCVLL